LPDFLPLEIKKKAFCKRELFYFSSPNPPHQGRALREGPVFTEVLVGFAPKP